jgi:hypothetical protein
MPLNMDVHHMDGSVSIDDVADDIHQVKEGS